ncbi:hypothetical protein R5R35_011342 [Gryllus longicercus]|uniref:Uncharacterized protein n=1 Tax=Gryllus longicercus TaxID=2509291 RepID=A0AAN9W058_9ORTH
MAIAAAENFQLKWHSYGAYMHTSVATLLRSESFTDITLATIDGRQIHAHRFVLSACSSYLHQLLRVVYPTTNGNLPVVIVLPSEISYRILKVLIEYMYSGEATVSYGQLDGILKAAHILGIRGLCRESNTVERSSSSLSSHKHTHNESQNERIVKQSRAPVENNERVVDDDRSSAVSNDVSPHETYEDVPLQLRDITQNSNRSSEEEESQKKESSRQSSSVENSSAKSGPPSDGSDAVNPVQLVVKQEPIEWVDTELEEPGDDDLGEPMHTEMTVKPEVLQTVAEGEEEDTTLYTPLTCDICQKTFTAPAEWVRHIEAHPEIYQQSTKHRGSKNSEKVPGSADQGTDFPPLRCELCELVFSSPGDWVRHIQNSHTEQELAISNNSYQHTKMKRSGRKLCQVCSKTFPSYASMMIHRRTHTGERPYICPICSKGFNVKSNLLRHLRTLHDQIVSPSTVD